MTNGATPIKKWAAELRILLWCKDHPALVGVEAGAEAAKAEVRTDGLLLILLLEPVEPVGVVAVGSGVPLVGVPSVKAAVVAEPVIEERDVGGGVDGSGMDPEEAGEEKLVEPGEQIRVMAKAGLVSPESPNTKNPNPYT